MSVALHPQAGQEADALPVGLAEAVHGVAGHGRDDCRHEIGFSGESFEAVVGKIHQEA
jgi:hypothetical protein